MAEKLEQSFEEYLDKQLNIKYLSEEQTNELITKTRNGDKDAEEKLYRYHGKYVRKMARDFAKGSVPFEDLYQEGMIGLGNAIKLYDESRDNKFMSFAHYHIYAKIMDYNLRNSKNTRLPRHVSELLLNYNKMLKLVEIGALPEMSEIDQAHYLKCSLDRLNELKTITLNDVSIYSSKDETSGEIIETIEAPSRNQPEIVMETQWIREEVDELLDILNDREAQVIKWKLGFDCEEHTFDEIADKLDMTRQGANNIYKRALEKLKIFCRRNNKKLEDLLY